MESTEVNLLGHEWTALHRDCERGERSALWIKLGAVALAIVAVALSFDAVLTMLLTLVLWVQEAILRTGQARLVSRLLRVEFMLREAAPDVGQACQLYSEWESGRPSSMGLVAQYLSSAARPTVAFPYVPLIVLLWGVTVVG